MKKNKKFEINIKNMGINIDKNEFQEIVLSNSNRPEAAGYTKSGTNPVQKYFKAKKQQ